MASGQSLHESFVPLLVQILRVKGVTFASLEQLPESFANLAFGIPMKAPGHQGNLASAQTPLNVLLDEDVRGSGWHLISREFARSDGSTTAAHSAYSLVFDATEDKNFIFTLSWIDGAWSLITYEIPRDREIAFAAQLLADSGTTEDILDANGALIQLKGPIDRVNDAVGIVRPQSFRGMAHSFSYLPPSADATTSTLVTRWPKGAGPNFHRAAIGLSAGPEYITVERLDVNPQTGAILAVWGSGPQGEQIAPYKDAAGARMTQIIDEREAPTLPPRLISP